jgi:hypothetical protein
MTTSELKKSLPLNEDCPEDLARVLNAILKKGIIGGTIAAEKGGWIWWSLHGPETLRPRDENNTRQL